MLASPRHVLVRSALVLALAAGSGVVAWLLLREQAPTDERTLSFAVIPGTNLAADRVPDAIRSLGGGQTGGPLGTIAAVVGSQEFVQEAGASALGRPLGERYEADVGV